MTYKQICPKGTSTVRLYSPHVQDTHDGSNRSRTRLGFQVYNQTHKHIHILGTYSKTTTLYSNYTPYLISIQKPKPTLPTILTLTISRVTLARVHHNFPTQSLTSQPLQSSQHFNPSFPNILIPQYNPIYSR